MKKTAMSSKESLTLSKMLNSIKKAREIYKPSLFWKDVGQMHINQLTRYGFKNFKTQQGLSYFTFLIFAWRDWQFQYVWKNTNIITKIKSIINGFTHPPFKQHFMTRRQRLIYITYVCMLWDFTKKLDKYDLLSIPEPKIGNPLLIRWRNKLISQDLPNSVLETYSMLEALSKNKVDPKTILELGGGYGRNAYILKHQFPKAKIIMADIPPTLNIAQWYLPKVFPKARILEFSEFKSFNEIKKDYDKADFVFILPSQLELLPNKSIDLFLSINSLQEMTIEQIKNYFNQINRLTRKIFYIKQWKKARNNIDKMYIKENEYPIKSKWKKIFHRDAKVQTEFFEAAYNLKNG